MTENARWRSAREAVVCFARRMASDGLVQYAAGNVSCRLPQEPHLVAVTPSGLPYDEMEPSDVAIVDLSGGTVDASLAPTSELPLHTLMYDRRPDVGAVIHTHGPCSTVLAAQGRQLPAVISPLVVAAGGAIESAPYARGGTAEMVEYTLPLLEDRSACFLRQHGLLAIGRTLSDAYEAAAVVEHSARVYLGAVTCGGAEGLPEAEIERLREKWRHRWSAAAVAGLSAN